MKIKILLLFCFLTYSYSQLLITNNGPCTCDLTSNACDINCCCDTTCSALQIQSFSCPNDQISPASYGCFPTELLFQNNTAFLNVTVGNQYCVYQDNFTMRNFYVAPTILSLTDISAIADYNDMPSLNYVFIASSVFSSQLYTAGSTIYSLVANKNVGILSISRPDFGGACVDGMPIGYLTDEVVSCNRVITNMATDCLTLPGISTYYDPNMLVPAKPYFMTNNSTGSSNSENFAAVTCNGCSGLTTPTYNSVNGTCSNVVIKLTYEVLGETNITAVVITMITNTISSSFFQTFNVSFNKSGYTTTGIKNSGNPGYIQGLPVKSISASGSMQDMTLINGGPCNAGTNSSILFGVNSYSDCNVSIPSVGNTAQVINNHVNASLSPYLAPFVAAYGNLSSVNQVSLTINDDSSSSNTLVVTKLTVYFIFARTGTLTLPQNKIIGYQSTYSYGSVTTFGQQYWVSVVVKFVDNSLPLFDLDAQVARLNAGNTVRDFLYLLYVDNEALRLGPLTRTVAIVAIISLLRLLPLD